MGSTLTQLIFHVVFSTKNHKPFILHQIRNELYSYIGGIAKGENAILLQIGGTQDHLHLVLKLKPTHTLSTLIQKIKGNSSKWLNEQKDLDFKFSWQEGYALLLLVNPN